jgi:ATP-binding cassette subfamily B protein
VKRNSLARLWSYLGRDKWLLGLAMLLDLVWAAANSLGITWSIKTIMNAASVRSLPMLVIGAEYLVATVAVMAIFGPAGGYLVSLVTERAARSLRSRIFAAALGGEAKHLDSRESGDTIARLVNDVETAKQGYATLHDGVSQVWQLLWSLGTLLVMNWPLAVAAMGFALLCFLASVGFAKPLKSLSLAYQAGLSTVTESATNLLSGVATVKGLRAAEAASARFDAVTEEHLAVGRKRARVMGLQNGVMNAMPFVALSAMIYVAGRAVFGQGIPAGDAVALAQLSTRCLFPLTILGNVWATLQLNLAAVDRVSEGIEIPQERTPESDIAGASESGCASAPTSASSPALNLAGSALESEHMSNLAGSPPSIEFRNVSFAYNGQKQVLNNVSFAVAGGQRMALAGSSGSGKTTVLKLLLGMYAPGDGAVLLGGIDVRKLSLKEVRRAVAVLPQEPWLFPGTIKENILLGKAGATDEEVVRAARLAHAHEFIEALPSGYDTVLDERGSNLSGGQRQRLCLARAFLKDAPVLFLDEPTASVDAESERLISDAVERLSEGRTVVTIAHTSAMLERADTRVILEAGRVVPA